VVISPTRFVWRGWVTPLQTKGIFPDESGSLIEDMALPAVAASLMARRIDVSPYRRKLAVISGLGAQGEKRCQRSAARMLPGLG
jgi:hypothetical protein